jgi:hypothetical protein
MYFHCKYMSPRISSVLALAMSTQSQAAVIDTFVSGSQGISWPPAQGSAAITTIVPLVDSLFETRFLSFRVGGSQSLTVTTSEQILEYSLGLGGGGYFQFGYRSLIPVNLLGDGASMLRFHFDGATAGTRFPANLLLVTSAGQATYSWGFELTSIFNDNDGSFTVDVPFSEIRGGDLTRVTEIIFDGLRITEGAGFRISRIETIPEPETLGIILLGAIPFLLKRSRTRKAEQAGTGQPATRYVLDFQGGYILHHVSVGRSR